MRVHLVSGADRSTGTRDEGAVAILAAVLMVLFLIMAAFALDVGNAYAQSRQLSVAADAAAVAAAAKVGEAMPTNTACTQAALNGLKNSSGQVVGAQAIALQVATDMNNTNARGGSSPAPTVTVSCVPYSSTDTVANAIEVTVSNHRDVKTFIAGVIGIDTFSPNATATARYLRTSSIGGLRPWAACADTVLAAKNNPGTTYWTGIDSMPTAGGGPCNGYTAGNWGAIDFNGGSNGAPDLIDWTLNGYPGPVAIPSTIPADPGVTNSVADALHSLVGQVVSFPAVTGYNGGNGNNASFAAVGIASVKVCAIQWQNNFWTSDLNGADSGCWQQPSPPTSTTSTTTASSTASATMKKNTDTTLSVATAIFPSLPVPSNVSVSVKITQATGNNPKSFTAPVASFTSTTQVVLGSAPGFDVAVGDKVDITVSTITGTGGFGPYVYQGNKWNVLNHIQFRYSDYTTSSWNGPNPTPCDPTNNALCQGITILWK